MAMINPIYLKAGVSCLPYVGPLVCLHNMRPHRNVLQETHEFELDGWKDKTPQDYYRQPEGYWKLQPKMEKLTRTLRIIRIYAMGGLIGSSLTVAIEVQRLAFSMFSKISIAASCVFAVWCSYTIYLRSQQIETYSAKNILDGYDTANRAGHIKSNETHNRESLLISLQNMETTPLSE